ncbi:MAG: DNA polymerase [Nitrososphaera sp.]
MSDIKRFFRSRWGDGGRLIEADLSQIEVVVQAVLSGDGQMKQDVRDGVDFHCKRLAFKLGEDYDSVAERCKYDPVYIKMRKDIKVFSFQRAYGAGVTKISDTLGIPQAEVREFIRVEEELYPGVVTMQKAWIAEVERSRKPTTQRSALGVPVGRGWLRSCLGKRYVFTEEDAPDFLRNRGVHTSFRPTQIKNYEVQGFAGEVLKLILGSLCRKLKSDSLISDGVLLINTIHDSIVLDARSGLVGVAIEVLRETFGSAPSLIESVYGLNFDLPIRGGISVGINWLEMEKVI